MIRLYGIPQSRAFRCIWMLEEARLDYEVVPVRFDDGSTQTPEFLAINPNGKIPALVDGETTVWESLAINLFLARRYGGLDPGDELGWSDACRWSLWAMGELEGPIDTARRLDVELPDGWAASPIRVLEQELADRPWLAGGDFSVADLNVAVMFQRPALAAIPRADTPALDAWLELCRSRDGYARMLERFRDG